MRPRISQYIGQDCKFHGARSGTDGMTVNSLTHPLCPTNAILGRRNTKMPRPEVQLIKITPERVDERMGGGSDRADQGLFQFWPVS